MSERRDTRLRFEQWARNPACQANTLSAVHGVLMAEVAKRDGTRPTMGQSPFALARGQNFERGLFKGEGKDLRAALEAAEVIPKGSKGFADFRLRQLGGRAASLDEAIEVTLQLLREMAKGGSAAGSATRPTLVAAATVRLPGRPMLPEAVLVLDVLTARYDADGAILTVGEVKTYPDRGGFTDGSELATARAQAGVYVHGLRVVARELGLEGRLRVGDRGFVVLSRPGSNRPSIRAGEDLRFQAKRAERGFQQLETAANSLPPPGESDPIAAIQRAETAYAQACVSFCDRAPTCYAAARLAEDPIILGDEVARFLGETSLARAMELLGGGRPKTPHEADLLRRLQTEEELLRT